MNTKFLFFFFEIRSWLMTIAKVLSLFSLLYFISKNDEYQVQWNLLTWLFPKITVSLNSVISSIGTFILLIPIP